MVNSEMPELKTRGQNHPFKIIGSGSGLARVMEQVYQVADREASVLLLGETGTGKGLVTSAIHKLSRRNQHPFVSVNCGAIPDSLVDSELFGYEKGAFTGAAGNKPGRFERANHGTIFLDEIGELPLPAQARLLHVLQEREIERVGGCQSIPLDIRIIAATHQDLEAMVEKGVFRQDLWFRLNIFPITIPPLRRRREDIPDLARYFLKRKSWKMGIDPCPCIRNSEMDALMDYHWPGNVRELENLVERALISHTTGPLALARLIPRVSRAPRGCAEPPRFDLPRISGTFLSLDQVNRIYIRKALASAKGKISGPGGAAALLDIHPSTLRKRMDKLGIRYKKEDRCCISA